MRGWINRIRSFSQMTYVVASGDVIQPCASAVKLASQLEWPGHEQI